MKRSTGARRNLMLFAAAVAVLTALIAIMLSRRPLMIMGPEPPAIVQKRHARENIYFDIKDIISTIPKKPKAAILPDREHPKQYYLPEVGSIGELIGVYRPDSDHEMVEYIERCEPVVARVRQVIAGKYFMWPEIGTENQHFSELNKFNILPRLIAACGTYRIHTEGADETTISYWIDAIKMAQMISSDGSPELYGMQAPINAVLRHIVMNLPRSASTELLKYTISKLTECQKIKFPAKQFLEFKWRQMDNSFKNRSGGLFAGRSLNRKLKFLLARVSEKQERRYIASNKERLIKLADVSYPEFKSGEYYDMQSHVFLSGMHSFESTRARRKTLFACALGVYALEVYRSEHGDYPESLDELVPEYLDVVPIDAYSGKPLLYKIEGNRYWLYSVGPDMTDNSYGKARRNGYDIVFLGGTGIEKKM